jgi:hypothetical protein
MLDMFHGGNWWGTWFSSKTVSYDVYQDLLQASVLYAFRLPNVINNTLSKSIIKGFGVLECSKLLLYCWPPCYG